MNQKGFRPFHVAEVGVWHPYTSNIYSYIKEGIKTTLVEPDPDSINLIKEKFSLYTNVTLHEVAVWDFNGKIDLYERESSTFVADLPKSPALINDGCDVNETGKFTANAKLFNEIDDGTIDLISIDTEGSDWFVIKNMISRPKIISIETHGGMYKNPYTKEILKWMDSNHYTLWYKDRSDSVFILNDAIPITWRDKLGLWKSEFSIMGKSLKKRVGETLKQIIKQPNP